MGRVVVVNNPGVTIAGLTFQTRNSEFLKVGIFAGTGAAAGTIRVDGNSLGTPDHTNFYRALWNARRCWSARASRRRAETR